MSNIEKNNKKTKLDLIRENLNMYDETIKKLITLRMSLIPLVAETKLENNLPIFQPKRETEIYKNIEIFAKKNGIDTELLKSIYKLIIANAIKIEEEIVEKPNTTMKKEIEISKLNNLNNNFNNLEKILNKEIPEIIDAIINDVNLDEYNLTQKSTLYYNMKINNKEV